MKRFLILLIPAFLIVLVGFTLIRNKNKIEEAKKTGIITDSQIPVEIVKAAVLPISGNLLKTGNLLPFNEASVMALGAGQVCEIHNELGTMVRKVEVIARIDDKLKRLALEQANLQVEKLAIDKQRYTDLLAGKATTTENLESIIFNYKDAVNKVSQLQKELKDMTVLSPITGQVNSKNIQRGEYINVGTTLAKIVDISRLKVQVQLDQLEAYQINVGEMVTITTDVYPDVAFKGKITYVAPEGDDLHNYLSEIVMDNNSMNTLKAGTFVYVDFKKQKTKAALQIPRDAIVESIKDPYVYIISHGKATVRNIKLGQVTGTMLEVVGGLSAGDEVITKGQINLKEGTFVKVTNN